MTYKNIVFDLDDTLYDQQLPLNVALRNVFQRLISNK